MTQDQTPSLRFPEFRGAWAVKPLGELCEVKGGKRIPKGSSVTETVSDYPYIRVTDMFMGGVDIASVRFISDEIEKKITNYKISKNDLFITVAGTIGIVGEIPEELHNANLTENANKLIIKKIVKNYLLQYLMGTPAQKMIASAITNNAQPKLALSQIKLFSVLFPSDLEQKKIAECLSSLDEVITAQGDRLDRLKDYKRGLIQQIFPADGQTTPAHRFREFQGTGAWEAKQMGEIVTFKKGTGIAKNDITKDGVNPCIRYGELFSDYGEIINTVKSKTHRDIKEAVLSEDNDILMATSGFAPIALAKACALSQKGVIVGGDMLIIRSNQILNRFFAYYISANKEKVMRRAAGVTVYHVYKSDIASIEILLPPLAEQQRIADCLSSLDDLITVQKQKIKTLKHHKNGLMQQLFPKL